MSGTFVVELQLLADASLERSHLITQLVLAVLDNRHERLLAKKQNGENVPL
jgi:hypothetical protein